MEKNLARRKHIQVDNRTEYDNSILTLKGRVLDMEGQDMREAIQVRNEFVAKILCAKPYALVT